MAALKDIYDVVGRATFSCWSCLEQPPWRRHSAFREVTEQLRLMASALPDLEQLPSQYLDPERVESRMLEVNIPDSLRTRWPGLGRFASFLPKEQVNILRYECMDQ